MASQVPRILRKQYYLPSSGNQHNSLKSDPIFAKFEVIRKKLEEAKKSTGSIDPESISLFYYLNDFFRELQILRDQKKSIKTIFSFQDLVSLMNLDQSHIEEKLNKLDTLIRPGEAASSSQPNLLLQFDRHAFYKHDRIHHGDVFDEREKQLDRWLSASGDFKAIGISGTGALGKTALVKNVLKQKSVQDKFKCVIWACLSQSAEEEDTEMEDVRIIEYLLYRLGLDTDDNLVEDVDDQNYKDWLMEQLKRRLPKNYILVFDDMWRCGNWFAGDFLKKLKENGGGSGTVIVTSRIKAVAEKVAHQNNMLIHLKPWDDYKESKFVKDEYRNLGN